MMPLGAALLVILAMPRVVAGPRRRLLAVAAITFATSVAPYVFELSRGLRRLSFGEAGRLNYAWLVSREIPSTAGWVGHTRESGNPLHPPRLLRVEPTVLEFNRTVPGTYPLWYNPSFFHEGLQVHFDARKQAAALTGSCPAIVAAHGSEWGQLLAGIGILAAFVVRRRLEFKFSNLWLVLWALSAVSLFALVASILARHVSPFIVLFWLAAYASFSPGALPADRALHRKLTSAVALFVLLPQAVLLGAAALYLLADAPAGRSNRRGKRTYPAWASARRRDCDCRVPVLRVLCQIGSTARGFKYWVPWRGGLRQRPILDTERRQPQGVGRGPPALRRQGNCEFSGMRQRQP